MTAWKLKILISLYPPYLGAGIGVKSISPDFREIIVAMKLRWYNRNYVNTHFGGSLYAMTDPFYMLMLMHILGREYTVWDKSAAIDFMEPGRGTVTARFHLTDGIIDDIIEKAEDGKPVFPEFSVDVVDEKGSVVARVRKTLYVRKRK